MKNILLMMLLGLGSLAAWGQAFTPCDDKGISTDPANPVNTETGSAVQLNPFDWTNSLYPINSSYLVDNFIESPWHQDDNLNVLSLFLEKDRLPEDGWELIKYDMGTEPDGSASSISAGFVYVVLYNRYTGVLRVCVAGDRPQSYNGAEIGLALDNLGAIEYYPSVLSHISDMKPVAVFAAEDLKAISASRYLNGNGNWFYADFAMAYDPCTCNYESRMAASVALIDSAFVNISGVIADSVLANLQGKTNGSVEQNGWSVSPKDLASFGKTAQKSYKSANEFTSKQKDALKYEGMTPAQVDSIKKKREIALNSFQEFIKSDGFLKEGLTKYPHLAVALELVKFFVNGGKKSGGSASPVAINTGIRLQGSIHAPYDFKDIIFSTPGSHDANNNQQEQYPYYNEPMGVFNLLETPEGYINQREIGTQCWNLTQIQRPCGHQQGHVHWNEVALSLKDDSHLAYVLNPASGLVISEIYASLEYHINIADNYPEPQALGSNLLATEGLDLPLDIYQTPLVPLGCLSDATLRLKYPSQVGGGSPSPAFKAYLKLFVNLARQDGEGQHVLWVGSFPVALTELSSHTDSEFTSHIPDVSRNVVLDASQVVTSDVLSIDSIWVKQGTNLQAGVTLMAPYIEVEPGVTIPSGVELIQGYPITCSTPLVPASASVISSFCGSSVYQSNERDASKQQLDTTVIFPLTLHPNPTPGPLTLSFHLPEATPATLQVYDLTGRLVATPFTDRPFKPGPQQVELNLSELPAGLYSAVFTAGTQRGTTKVVVER